MSHSGSPLFANGYEEDPIFQKSHYTQDISEQMRVPKRIRATGEYFDDYDVANSNGDANSWNFNEKINMTVPDRLVVLGQDQHLGTRSAPREIVLDNSILPKNPTHVRVATPPRTITLAEHHFPTASEGPQFPLDEEHAEYDSNPSSTIDDRQAVRAIRPQKMYFNQDMLNTSRETTPPLGQSNEHLTPSEEVMHLRRQLAKLNRRVLSIEIENVQRQQRDKIVYCIGLAYFLMKAIMWMNRN